MACLKHGKELGRLLTDKGSCPWCHIDELAEEVKKLNKKWDEAEATASEWEESANNSRDEIESLEATILDMKDEFHSMQNDLLAEIRGLESELSRAEQEIMDGS